MTYAFAFSPEANLPEVVRLADGRLAERSYNARKGKFGWTIYGTNLVTEAWLTDAQFARL